ncbi:PEP/pyruvate-binding domain-containing protein [Chloroflexota bacterium]
MAKHKVQRAPQIAYIMKLGELSRGDSDCAGAKAASLGELYRVGFTVPDGFVLTTDAFKRFLLSNNISADSSPEAVAASVIPADIANALLAAANELGYVALAVRSSGVAEDLPDASFAGQYETVLNVRGKDALLSAVRHCWSSAFNERVLAYRKAQGQGKITGMAVLVQCLVLADAAGVAFTANPVTGKRDEAIVNAVRGLGERLVSGQVSPDEWMVKGDRVTCQSASEDAINADQARAVAKLARRVEAHYGLPQDIEWAYAGGELFLLQARPITALPDESEAHIPMPLAPPPGFWYRSIHRPEPIMPMDRSICQEAFNNATRQLCDELGLLIEAIELREIGGWVYNRQVPIVGKEGSTLQASLLVIQDRMKKCIEAIRSDRVGHIMRLWYGEWKPSLIARIAELRDIDLHGLTDSALDEHIGALVSFFRESSVYHHRLFSVGVPLATLAFACRDMLGWEDAETMELLSGLSEKSNEPTHRLAELVQMAVERPTVRTFLEKGDYTNADRLGKVDPEFATAFGAYQHEFGYRSLQMTFCEPTLAEKPALILGLIRDQLVQSFDLTATRAALDEKRTAALDKARAALTVQPAEHKERFERALAGAELAFPVREDNHFYTQSVPFGLVRYGLLELGNRLTKRSQIADCDDVFFLEIDEAREALRVGNNNWALVARRKAEYAWAKAHPGPVTYGRKPGPYSSFASFPAEVRFMMNAVIWYIERTLAGNVLGKVQPKADSRISGIAGSAGRYTGPVRVIMSESEFGKIQAGDVLVCPITFPAWSVLFPSVGALITDTGGILSHPAIIAREYGVPAVVSTGNATSFLRDGQIVTVDGSAGVIELS